MGLVTYLLIFIAIGVLCGFAIRVFNMPPPFTTAIPVVAVAVMVLILFLIMFGKIPDVPIPKLR